MDIKDMEFFRLEDRMLFEAAAAANIVAAADAAQNAGDDGNNDEEKNNTDLNVALFVAPEAQNDNDAANANAANATDIDAQAKALVEGELPTMDDSISIIPVADANANVDADADAQVDAHHDFVEGTLHADNADTFTIDADADADHDILGNWLTNDDIDGTNDTVSVDGAVAAIAAEHTIIDIDADVDADADVDSDDFDADTRGGTHELSLDFTAHKTYDGTVDVEDGELEMNATLDGISLHVSGAFDNDSWTFNFTDDASNSYVVTVQDVVFDGKDVSTDSITIGTFSIDGDSLSDIDIIVNGEELLNTRAGEGLRADGVIGQREITISIQDKDMTYGEDETNLRFHYKVTGELLENEFISADYELASYLDAFRTAKDADGNGGNIQYRATPYKDAITFKLDKLKIFDSKGTNVTDNYIINTENGDLTVAQRMLSVTIQPLVFVYGQDIGDVPDYGLDKDGNPNVSYTFDSHGLVAGDDLSVTLKYNPKPLEGQYSNSGYLGSNSYTNAIIQDEVNLENASNYSVQWNSGTLIVTPKQINVDYLTKSKVYDGTTKAERNTEAEFLLSEEIIAGDIVKLFDTNVIYTFESPNVGKNIKVTATNDFFALGQDASNYNFVFNLISKGDITPADAKIKFEAQNKVYDGNADANLKTVTIEGLIADGDVTIDAGKMTYAFSDPNVGKGKTVTAIGYSEDLLGGSQLKNYKVNFEETTTAEITPLDITIGFTAKGKVYDGDTDAERNELVMNQVLAGDEVAFDDSAIEYNFDTKDVGTGKTVTATGFDKSMLSGKDLGNYNVRFVETAEAYITPLAITIGFTANDKTYDGNTIATRDQLLMDQVLEGDDVAFDDSGIEYNFDTKETGEDKTVTATGFDAATMLSGDNLDNYDITFIDTTLADITAKAITVKADDKTMTYGDPNPSLTYTYDGDFPAGHYITVALDMDIAETSITDTGHIKAGSYENSITAVATIYDENGNEVTSDYTINYDFGDLTVDLRNITVTAASQKMTYGEKMPDIAGKYSFDPNALADGDKLEVLLKYDDAIDRTTSGNVVAGLHTHAILEETHTLTNGENYYYTFNDASLNVIAKQITVRFDAADKDYDGNATAEREGDFVLDGFVKGDVVHVFDNDVTYAFSDKNAGLDKTVTATGKLVYVGDDVDNYTFDFENTTLANITPLKIKIGFTASTKTYDGNDDAVRYQLVMDKVFEGDDVSFDDSAIEYNFSDKNVGKDKTVTATGYDADTMLSGKDLDNYDITFVDTALADITPLAITIGFTANDKTYDGNDVAERNELVMDQVLEGDDVSFDDSALEYNFDDKNVGKGKTVTATGYDANSMLSGKDLDNYSITFIDTTTANINKLAITIGFTANNKTYDGNTIATRDQLVMDQVLKDDNVVFDDSSLEYNFDTKDAGEGKIVTATGYDADSMLSGKDLGNYDITFIDTTTARIDKLGITIGFTAKNKNYDGTTVATRDQLVMDQVLEGDDVAFDDSGLEYNFDTKAPGFDKTVTATGFDADSMLSGEDLNNYDITFIDTTLANIFTKSITVKADDKTMTYGDAAPSLTYTYDGDLADGHYVAVVLNLDIPEEHITNTGHIKAGQYVDTITAVATIYDENGNVITDDYTINYDFGDLTVDLRNITVTAAGQSMTYGDDMPGLGQDGAYSFDPNALASGDTLTVTLEYDIKDDALSSSGNVAAGLHTHAIVESSHTLSNGENYNYTFNDASLTVTPREVTVTFGAADKTYDGNADATREGAFDIAGFVDGDDVRVFDTDVSYSFSDKNVGTDKTVTATGDLTYVGDDMDNYSFIFDNTAEADITPLHIIVTANDQSMIYGDEVPSLTYTFTDDLAGDDMISITLSLNVSDEAYTDSGHIKAGEYTDAITGTAVIYDDEGILVTNNYEIEFVFGKLSVDLRNITVTAKPQEMIYGDDMPDLDGQYSFDENALASGDSLAVTLFYDIDPNQDISSSGNVVAGLHSGMVNEKSHDLSNAENYNYTFNAASLNVLPKDVIVSFAAANKTYDGNTDASRDGDFIIDGFINGDQIKVFDTEVTYAFDAPTVLRDTDGTVLDRTVTANGEFIAIGKDVDNYNINFVDTAEAKITPLALTVTAISQSMTYGDENPDLTAQYTVEGLLDIDTLDVTLDYDFNNIAASDSGHFKAGKHEDAIIEASHTLSNEDSYDYTFIAADLTVGKRPITIAADDQEITYGDEVGELTYVTAGELADGDSIDDTTLKIDGKENANGHYNAGKYDIIIDELSIDANDYDITYDPGTLLVNQKEIIITADDKTKQEREPDPRFTYTVDGLLDNDKVVGRLTRRPGEAPGEYEIRQGTLVATGNYIITYIPGTLTITGSPEEPEETPTPSLRNIYQEPDQSNRNYNGPSEFEVIDYSPVIPDIHPKWDFRSRFDAHRINPLANSQDLWMDIDSLDTILVSKVISASNSANERGFSSGNEMFPNDTQTDIFNVHPSDDFDSPLIDYIDVHGSNDNDMPWIFLDESIQIPKSLELNIADDTTEDTDMLDMLAGIDLNEPSKHAAFKSEVELLLDGLLA